MRYQNDNVGHSKWDNIGRAVHLVSNPSKNGYLVEKIWFACQARVYEFYKRMNATLTKI